MADEFNVVNSAGTLIGAVMETAGYVVHARILDDFQGLLTNTGALFYAVAGVGAIISVALFGSYRMAQYLLLGPALFYFLVQSRAEIDPALWKLGGGDGKLVSDAFAGQMEEYKPLTRPKVSQFFYWYTTIISNLVNHISDQIVKIESEEQLLFIGRSQIYDLVINARPQKAQLYEVLSGTLLSDCEEMMRYAVALSSPTFSPAVELAMTSRLNGTTVPEERKLIEADILRVNETRKALNKGYCVAAGLHWNETTAKCEGEGQEEEETGVQLVAANTAIKDFIRRELQGGSPAHQYDKLYTKQNLTGESFIQQELPNLMLRCTDVYTVARDAIMRDAAWFLEKVETAHFKPELQEDGTLEDTTANEQLLCKTIAEKLYRDYKSQNAGECSLVEAAGTYMMRSMISDLTYSEVARQHKNRMEIWKGANESVFTDKASLSDNPEDRFVKIPLGAPLQFRIENGRLEARDMLAEANDKDGTVEEQWRPFTKIEIGGMMETSYTMQQRYQTRGLLQGIFSYAVNLPYWQGVLLYLLAVGYPFLTVLVLLPNRATAFLYLPLGWLWVKSWDIGFAVVMILDKTLWNMLPQTDLEYDPAAFDPTNPVKNLPDVLSSVLEVDPSYDIHIHYNFVSMALFSVPAITGYAIMKGKSSILSSFTDGPKGVANDAQDLGSGSFGIGMMNKFHQHMYELGGTGMEAIGFRGQGFMGQGRGADAIQWGAVRGSVTAATSFLKSWQPSIGFGGGAGAGGGGGGGSSGARRSAKDDITKPNVSMREWANEQVWLKDGQKEQREYDRGGYTRNPAQYREALANDRLKYLDNIQDAIIKGSDAAMDVLTAEVKQAAMEMKSFDPVFGRVGRYQMLLASFSAGMDGGGGFELEHMGDVSGVLRPAVVDLFLTKVKLSFEMGLDVSDALADVLLHQGRHKSLLDKVKWDIDENGQVILPGDSSLSVPGGSAALNLFTYGLARGIYPFLSDDTVVTDNFTYRMYEDDERGTYYRPEKEKAKEREKKGK